MNYLQKKAIDLALEGHNLLLLGSAGTGKSFVINDIAKQLKEKGKTVQITCSTGIACSVYGEKACTIHKFTGISDGRHGPNNIVDVIKNNPKYEYVINNISKVDTVIVDECSMISEQVFDTLHQVFKIKDPISTFGGVQIIFCDDFYQLPPVANPSYGDTGNYCFQSKDFKLVFPHRVVLEETMRQNEEHFITAIKDMSHGQSSEETEDFILSLNRPLILPEGSRSVKLFSRNDFVNDYNRKCLIDYPGTIYEFQSSDTGQTKHLAKLTAPRLLWLKKGCPVILLRNLTDILVNGLSGYIHEVDNAGVVVNFTSVNLITRIPKVKFTVYSPVMNSDIAVREQYPLKLGFGLTIHKAQGMTLSSVEVDCRDIFKAGQLAVAMSRATTSAGLRIINFHPRYVIPQPHAVMEFMKSSVVLSDITYCRELNSSPCHDEKVHTTEDARNKKDIEADIEDLEQADDYENLDDDFNDILETITSIELEAIEFEIPQTFSIASVIEGIKYKKEVTETHTYINEILYRIDHLKVLTFVKKVFVKFAEFVIKLTGKKKSSTGVPEANMAQYYRLAHTFTTSAEYTLICIDLFQNEGSFSDNHRIVCYNIVEAIRLFYLKQKVDLLNITKGNIPTRHVTNASRARVRYVAGYCIASLRRKYTQIQNSNLYSKTINGQNTYIEAKYTVSILSVLKEEENYLKTNTNEPESLVDVERRQFSSRGLTNVTDSLFNFFLELTEESMTVFVHENLMTFGKSMYNTCVEIIMKNEILYKLFISVVINRTSNTHIHELGEDQDINSVLQEMVIISSQTYSLYRELVEKYLMVLLAQFRKDFKSNLRVEKTMAHRKQIKVSNQSKKPVPKTVSKKTVSTQKTISKSQSKRDDPKPVQTSEPSDNLQLCQSNKPQPGTSYEPQPGTSIQLQPCTTIEPQPSTSIELQPASFTNPQPDLIEDDSELCQKCFTEKEDQWVQCDSCNSWFHRNCASLKAARLWKKFSKDGATWFCKSCQ